MLPPSATGPQLLAPLHPHTLLLRAGGRDSGGRTVAPNWMMGIRNFSRKKGGEAVSGNNHIYNPLVPHPCPPSLAQHPLLLPRPPPWQRFSSALGTISSFSCQSTFRLRLWGHLWEMLCSRRPPALTELALPPCPDSLTMAGVQGGDSVLGTALVRCSKAGTDVAKQEPGWL